MAVQLAGIGIDVVVGSRSEERAAATVTELKERWPGRDLPLHPADNDGAAGADLVVVATPWEGVLTTVSALEERLAGKIVISMANALTRWGRDMVPLLPPTGSVTVAVARALPRSRVVGAFHHLPAGPWADLDHPLDADVLVCSDDRAATREVIALIDRLPGPPRRRCGKPVQRPGHRGPDPGAARDQPALQDPRRRCGSPAARAGRPNGVTGRGALRHRQEDGSSPSSPGRS